MKCAPLFLCLLLLAPPVFSQTQNPSPATTISLGPATYSQNFNTLNLNPLVDSSTLPAGWLMSETGSAANAAYSASAGFTAAGDTYSYGTTLSTDRAFGTLRDGTLASTIGAVFVNNTGSLITRLTISFTGELWRSGGGTVADQLTFGLNTNVANLSAALTTGTFLAVSALNFNSPVTGAAAGALDGNATANRTQITATITGLSIPIGQTFAIRWNDLSVAANDGLAIDDFSINPNVPEPGTVMAGLLAVSGLAWHQRHRLRQLLAHS